MAGTGLGRRGPARWAVISLTVGLIGAALPSALATPEEEAQTQYRLGETYYQTRQWPDAIVSYQKFLALKADPGDRPFGAAHLGDCEFNLKHFAEAAAAYRMAVDEAKDAKVLSYATYWLAESLMAQKDAAGALKAYSDVVDKYPQSDTASFALLGKAVCLTQLDRAREAIPVFRAFLEKYPKSDSVAEATYRLGDALYNTGDFASAETTYQQVVTGYWPVYCRATGGRRDAAQRRPSWAIYRGCQGPARWFRVDRAIPEDRRRFRAAIGAVQGS